MYGISKCDYNRLLNLFRYLPEDATALDISVFEPQHSIVNKIADNTKNKYQSKANRPLYIPHAGLTTIMKNSIKTVQQSYALSYEWENDLKACPTYKSYIDVCYLYEFVRAVQSVANGEKLG